LKLSTRGRYGVKILLDLALNQDNGPVPVGEISRRQGISVKYIDQLMQPLKKEGFVKSVRGPQGGYLLNQPAAAITLGKVVAAMEGQIKTVDCIGDDDVCGHTADCLIRQSWQRAITAMFAELDAVNLSAFHKRSGEGVENSPERPCGALL